MKVLYSMLGIFLTWQIFSTVFDSPILPTPIAVFIELGNIFSDRISIHALHSFLRIFIGLSISILIGFPIGIIIGRNNRADQILSPIIYLLYPVPKIALLPIAMLLFGLGELSKIVLIVAIIVFQITISVRDAVQEIPTEYFEPMYSLGANNFEMFRDVIFPAVLPKFLTSIRISLATAISVLFFTETFGTEYGMGFYIFDAWQRINYLEMYCGIVVLSLMGLMIFIAMDIIEKFSCRWMK